MKVCSNSSRTGSEILASTGSSRCCTFRTREPPPRKSPWDEAMLQRDWTFVNHGFYNTRYITGFEPGFFDSAMNSCSVRAGTDECT